MIDLHSHVLPQMDDGSASPEESLKLLEESKKQGVSVLCATPHFYAMTDSPSSFLERREKALSVMRPLIPSGMRVISGAEVFYYDGISRSDSLTVLTFEGTGLLLLEMPFSRWTERMLDEICYLADTHTVFPMLAHVDRYLGWQKTEVWYRLAEHGVGMQVNAEGILTRYIMRKLTRLFQEEMIDAVGSDMHNMSLRKPRLQEAEAILIRRFGSEMPAAIEERSSFLLQNA